MRTHNRQYHGKAIQQCVGVMSIHWEVCVCVHALEQTVTVCVYRWVSGWTPCLTTWNTSHATSSPVTLTPSWCPPTPQLWTPLTSSCPGRIRCEIQTWNADSLQTVSCLCWFSMCVWTVSSRTAPALSVSWRWVRFRCVASDASPTCPPFPRSWRTFPTASVQSQARRSSAASHWLQVA